MNDPIIYVIGIFGGGLGLLFGGLIGFMLGRRNKAIPPEPTVSEVAHSPAPPPPPPAPARNTPKDSAEVLSLWRNERSGKMMVMLETKPLSPSHLTEDQKTKMSHLLTSLHTMIGDVTPPPVAPPAAPPPAIPETPKPAPSSSALLTESADDPMPSPAGEPDIQHVKEPASDQPQKIYFADSLPEPVSVGQALLSNPFKITPPPGLQKPTGNPKSIVEQIDEIFQSKLPGTPFENTKIELKESVNGMTILVESYKYEGIDAVPDANIRALIKESAREWNEKVSRKQR